MECLMIIITIIEGEEEDGDQSNKETVSYKILREGTELNDYCLIIHQILK